jgi:predicted ATPase
MLERAAQGGGGVALVTGEPGIGKTRLLEEVARCAMERSFVVCWGRAWEVGSAPTYWPWIEVLRTLLAQPGGRDANGLALLPLLPELETRGTRLARAQTNTLVDAFALCDLVTAYLLAASARAPLLIVLDDLHAADPSSLQLAEFVARSVRGARLCIVGSHRDVEARRTPEIDSALARLARTGERFLLPRLAVGEVASLLEAQTGREDGRTAQMIHDATEGNPLFVRELLRLIAARGAAAGGGVPAGVRAVIRERLGLLPAASVALLQAAAVVGREFSLRLAAEVAGVTPSALDEALADAKAAELLTSTQAGRWRFSHALVAETLAEELQGSQRTRLHRRAAEALERWRREDPSAVSLDELAYHWLQTGSEGAERAASAAAQAAEAAASRLAFADAAVGYERALSALAQVPNATEPASLGQVPLRSGRPSHRSNRSLRSRRRTRASGDRVRRCSRDRKRARRRQPARARRARTGRRGNGRLRRSRADPLARASVAQARTGRRTVARTRDGATRERSAAGAESDPTHRTRA